jgi:hypothetical protein
MRENLSLPGKETRVPPVQIRGSSQGVKVGGASLPGWSGRLAIGHSFGRSGAGPTSLNPVVRFRFPCLSTGPDLVNILKINLSYPGKMIFRIPQNFPGSGLRIFISYIKISFSIR